MKANALLLAALGVLLSSSTVLANEPVQSQSADSKPTLDRALQNLEYGTQASTRAGSQAAAQATTEPYGAMSAVPGPLSAPPPQDQSPSFPVAEIQTAANPPQAAAKGPVIKFQSPVVYIYEFSATWCPSCRRLAPVVEEAAEKYGSFVQYVPINVDKNQDLVKKLNIAQIPTVMVVDRRGRVLNRLVGLEQGSQIDVILGHYKAQTLASLGITQ